MAEVLVKAGSDRVITLNSQEGLDEVSCAGPTSLFLAEKGEGASVDITEMTVQPESFGFQRHDLQELKGSDASDNAKIVMEILGGEKGARREAVVMNAAIGFYVAGKSPTFKSGRELAEESIDSKKAFQALEMLKKVSHS
jgi:anthranilate phosphoribosyltransferase